MNDRDNFNDFYHAHYQRIHFQIHRLGISGDWYETFYQEGIIALWHAYTTHDKQKGEVGTYLNYKIRYRLIDLLRKKLRTQTKTEQLIEATKTTIDNGNRHKQTERPILPYTDIQIEDNAFWEEVRSHLTENQWKWVHYFLIAELSIKEIMEIEDVTRDAVKNWGRAVRKKLNTPSVKKKLEAILYDN